MRNSNNRLYFVDTVSVVGGYRGRVYFNDPNGTMKVVHKTDYKDNRFDAEEEAFEYADLNNLNTYNHREEL